MIKMLILFLLACAFLALGAVLVEEKGYVLINLAGYVWEASFFGFLFVLLLAYLAFKVVETFLIGLFRARKNFSAWRAKNKQATSLNNLSAAIEALFNQQWRKAQALSLKQVHNSPIPASHYLIAAEASKQLGELDESSLYQLRAQQDGSESDKQLATAKSLINEEKYPQAINTIEQVLERNNKDSAALLLLAQAYQYNKQFELLQNLLPKVKKYTDISPTELKGMCFAAYQPQFTEAVEQKNLALLEQSFKHINKLVEPNQTILQVYLASLVKLDANQQAEKFFIKLFEQSENKTELNQQNENNLKLLSNLAFTQPLKLIAWLEKQLKKQPEANVLKIALAICALKNSDVQLAQQAMESAIKHLKSPYSYQLMGEIYQQAKIEDKAKLCFEKGLQLAINQ
ncbi:protoheme IX biogenesis protein [Catenovulum agarivorans DS-2]|uniref:Protoheme IX biogenesis protein n=1 Tax=Catenovulum agarivorans DS-2 TaxID=1328313 RepID=W7QN03_9ALTE|nr:heme biosynthesis HemY N-terminal domain-containing protein [Catenovulum agarivorans]EWH10332.1 protoheme IX biogenesis protein [Catenovulum agarivorans DS-2]